MLAKIVFVLCLAAIFGASFGITPEEVKYLTADIAETIRSKEVVTFFRIKENEDIIKDLTDRAKKVIRDNLTDFAGPYWKKIEEFEQQSETSGVNISECVNSGNARFDTLSEDVIDEPLYKISLLEKSGNEAINSALSQLDKVLQDLSSLEEKVKACSDENCAATLEAEAEKFLPDALTVFLKALKRTYEFAQVKLETSLEKIAISSPSFVAAFYEILDDIAACIESLEITPEELKYLMADIAETIRSKEAVTFFRIKENEEIIRDLTDGAKKNIRDNLTASTEPYWNKIKTFEEQAQTCGVNISGCINDGHKRFDKLSENILDEPLYKISLLEKSGNATINSALNKVDKVLQDLLSLEEKVKACSDRNCATVLEAKAEQFLRYGVTAFLEALKKTYEFAQVKLKTSLEKITISSSIFVKAYNEILDDIAACIKIK